MAFRFWVVKSGWGVNERYAADPIGSNEPRGKDTSQRKHRNDGGWTPTEERQREQMLRQFMRNPEGTANRDESAYKTASCWCSGCDGRRLAVASGLCLNCASDYLKAVYAGSSERIVANLWPGIDANGSPVEGRLLGVDAETPRP